jgi:hypothetical protein
MSPLTSAYLFYPKNPNNSYTFPRRRVRGTTKNNVLFIPYSNIPYNPWLRGLKYPSNKAAMLARFLTVYSQNVYKYLRLYALFHARWCKILKYVNKIDMTTTNKKKITTQYIHDMFGSWADSSLQRTRDYSHEAKTLLSTPHKYRRWFRRLAFRANLYYWRRFNSLPERLFNRRIRRIVRSFMYRIVPLIPKKKSFFSSEQWNVHNRSRGRKPMNQMSIGLSPKPFLFYYRMMCRLLRRRVRERVKGKHYPSRYKKDYMMPESPVPPIGDYFQSVGRLQSPMRFPSNMNIVAFSRLALSSGSSQNHIWSMINWYKDVRFMTAHISYNIGRYKKGIDFAKMMLGYVRQAIATTEPTSPMRHSMNYIVTNYYNQFKTRLMDVDLDSTRLLCESFIRGALPLLHYKNTSSKLTTGYPRDATSVLYNYRYNLNLSTELYLPIDMRELPNIEIKNLTTVEKKTQAHLSMMYESTNTGQEPLFYTKASYVDASTGSLYTDSNDNLYTMHMLPITRRVTHNFNVLYVTSLVKHMLPCLVLKIRPRVAVLRQTFTTNGPVAYSRQDILLTYLYKVLFFRKFIHSLNHSVNYVRERQGSLTRYMGPARIKLVTSHSVVVHLRDLLSSMHLLDDDEMQLYSFLGLGKAFSTVSAILNAGHHKRIKVQPSLYNIYGGKHGFHENARGIPSVAEKWSRYIAQPTAARFEYIGDQLPYFKANAYSLLHDQWFISIMDKTLSSISPSCTFALRMYTRLTASRAVRDSTWRQVSVKYIYRQMKTPNTCLRLQHIDRPHVRGAPATNNTFLLNPYNYILRDSPRSITHGCSLVVSYSNYILSKTTKETWRYVKDEQITVNYYRHGLKPHSRRWWDAANVQISFPTLLRNTSINYYLFNISFRYSRYKMKRTLDKENIGIRHNASDMLTHAEHGFTTCYSPSTTHAHILTYRNMYSMLTNKE